MARKEKVMKCKEDYLDVLAYVQSRSGGTNEKELKHMSDFVKAAMLIEFTERQRRCITEYYMAHKSLRQIADELGLAAQSTVSYHINTGLKKIKKRIVYYNAQKSIRRNTER